MIWISDLGFIHLPLQGSLYDLLAFKHMVFLNYVLIPWEVILFVFLVLNILVHIMLLLLDIPDDFLGLELVYIGLMSSILDCSTFYHSPNFWDGV